MSKYRDSLWRMAGAMISARPCRPPGESEVHRFQRIDGRIPRYDSCPERPESTPAMPLFSLGERRVELRGERHFIAHDATLAGSILLENDVSIWFGVVIRADNDQVTIGAETNVQDGSVLHVDPGFPMTLGRNVTIGHKAMLHGCTVGDGTLIGINSVILNGAKIGAGTLVGANSLVSEGKDIPPGVLVLGSPAKVVRELTPEEKARVMEISHGYVARAKVFRTSLREQELPASAR